MAEATPVVETPIVPPVPPVPPVEPPAAVVASTEISAAPPPAVDPAPPVTPAPEGTPPHAPETYALTLPEDAPFSVQSLEARARALHLTNEQAQAMVNHDVAELAAFKHTVRAALDADPVLGGANLPLTQTLGRRGLDAIFPPGTPGNEKIRAFLNASGYGDDPDVIREFVRIGKTRTEDTPVAGGSLTTPTKRSLEERLVGD
jgi:hypothetical protein